MSHQPIPDESAPRPPGETPKSDPTALGAGATVTASLVLIVAACLAALIGLLFGCPQFSGAEGGFAAAVGPAMLVFGPFVILAAAVITAAVRANRGQTAWAAPLIGLVLLFINYQVATMLA